MNRSIHSQNATEKPKLFIGSSREGIESARAIQCLLQPDCEDKLWDGQEIFGLNHGALESLLKALPLLDFAVLVLTPDDTVVSRGTKKKSPRDNVIFEVGLLMGHLGRDRTFIVLDPDKIKVPSDWAGVTVLYYDSTREDLIAAFGPACTKIRNIIRTKGSRQISSADNPINLSGTGIISGYYDCHPLQEVLKKFRAAKKEIIILQTWISSWAELIEAIKEPLGITSGPVPHSKTIARFIFAHPESTLCEARGIHSGKPPGRSKVHAEASLAEINEFKRSFDIPDSRLEVRLSHELPTFALFGADDELYFTPYLRKLITVQSPCLRFHARSGLGGALSDHFNGLWEALPSINLKS